MNSIDLEKNLKQTNKKVNSSISRSKKKVIELNESKKKLKLQQVVQSTTLVDDPNEKSDNNNNNDDFFSMLDDDDYDIKSEFPEKKNIDIKEPIPIPIKVETIEDNIAHDMSSSMSLPSSSSSTETMENEILGIKIQSQLGVTADFNEFMRMMSQTSISNKVKIQQGHYGTVSAGIYAPRSSAMGTSGKRNLFNRMTDDPQNQHAGRSGRADTSGSGGGGSSLNTWESFFPMTDVLRFITTREGFYKTQLPGHAQAALKAPSTPECISSTHVRNVLTEVFSPFKGCIWGDNCKAYTDFSQFRAMEYVTPAQYEQAIKFGHVSSMEQNMCYICWLFAVMYLYVSNKAQGGVAQQIQVPFYFKKDEPNEYRAEALLPSQSKSQGRTSTENTYGLIVPFRSYSRYQFYLDQMSVTVGNGAPILVKCLKEADWLFFTEHPSNGPQALRVDPIKYATPVITNLPTTDMILTHHFNAKNTEHVIGLIRLQEFGIMNGIGEDQIPLYQYWCMTEQSQANVDINEVYDFEPFLWDVLFCKNIGHMANNLPQFIRSGRIDLDWLSMYKDLSLCIVDFTKPLTYYEYKLQDSQYEDRRLYLTLCLRIIILRTLLKVYPNSKNSKHDSNVHKHLRNFLKWHENVHCEKITPDTLDSTMDVTSNLKEFADSEIPFHMYPTDMAKFLKYRTEIRSKSMPYEAAARYYPEYAWFFTEFDSMLEQVRTNTDPENPIRQFLFSRETCVHLIIPPHLEKLYISEDPSIYSTYSILTCLLLRVNLAMHVHNETFDEVKAAYKEYKNINDHPKEYTRNDLLVAKSKLADIREKRYQVRLFAYTHMHTVTRMYDMALFTDDQLTLEGIDRGNKNFHVNHWTEIFPYSNVTVYEGMLVDLSTSVINVPFLGNCDETRPSNKPANETFKVLSKFLPRMNSTRNQVGCKIDKHIQFCEKHDVYLYFVVSILEVMLLGGYRHSDTLLPFMQMLTFYKFFNSHFDKTKFNKWQEERSGIVSAAMREYMCWTIERATPYDNFVTQNHTYWLKYRQRLYECTDIIRMTYCRTQDLKSFSAGCVLLVSNFSMSIKSDKVDELLKTWLGYTDDEPIPEVIQEHMTSIVPDKPMIKHIFLNPVREMCKHLYLLNAKRDRRGYRRMERLPPEVFKCVYAMVGSIKPQSPIDLMWFCEFNLVKDNPLIQINTIRILEYVMVYIMQGKSTADQIEEYLMMISPMEYEIVDTFFNLLLIHYSITVYTLPAEILEKQADALKRRFGIDLIENPNDEHSVYTFCAIYADCCTTLRSYTAQLHGDRAYGAKLVGINPYTNDMMCKSPTIKGMQRKTSRATKLRWNNLCEAVYTENETGLRRSIKVPTKSSVKFHNQPECGSVPVKPIFILGRVIQVTDTHLSMNDTKPATNALSICCNCGSLSDFSVRMYGSNSFECMVCEYGQVRDRYTPTCVSCKQKIKVTPVPHYFQVYNDRTDTGDMSIRNEYICQRCYKCKTANWHPQHIYTVTDIENSKHARETGMEWLSSARNGEELGDDRFTISHNNRKRLIKSRRKK